MLSVIAKTLAQNVAVNAPVNSDVNLSFDVESLKTPEAILVLIKHTPQMTRQQLADIIGKDIRTIGLAINKLQQASKLKRIGSDKTGHWEAQ
jgi:predicted HTH transcriptional regulator